MLKLLYFVTDGPGASNIKDPSEFALIQGPGTKETAFKQARKMWRENLGSIKPHIHRIDSETNGRKIREVWEWRPSDDDYVWLAETKLEARPRIRPARGGADKLSTGALRNTSLSLALSKAFLGRK